MMIFISGISGVGKSTISKELSQQLGLLHINQDNYYLKIKPKVTLSNNLQKSNWDTVEALDFDKLNTDLTNHFYQRQSFLLEGFCLRTDMIKFAPNVHIHLSYIPVPHDANIVDVYMKNKEVIINRIIKSRSISKPGIKDDEIVVRELVWPFYIETLKNSHIDYVLSTFDDAGNRIDLNIIMDKVIQILIMEGIVNVMI